MMSHIDQVSLISRKESFQMTMELESVKAITLETWYSILVLSLWNSDLFWTLVFTNFYSKTKDISIIECSLQKNLSLIENLLNSKMKELNTLKQKYT